MSLTGLCQETWYSTVVTVLRYGGIPKSLIGKALQGILQVVVRPISTNGGIQNDIIGRLTQETLLDIAFITFLSGGIQIGLIGQTLRGC